MIDGVQYNDDDNNNNRLRFELVTYTKGIIVLVCGKRPTLASSLLLVSCYEWMLTTGSDCHVVLLLIGQLFDEIATAALCGAAQ